MIPLAQAAIPEALKGDPPKWWGSDDPLVAAGPFAVEYGGGFRVGILLRPIEGEADTYGYSDGDREHVFRQTRDAVVKGRVMVVASDGGPILFRPLRESDLDAIAGLDGLGGSVEDRVRASFNW